MRTAANEPRLLVLRARAATRRPIWAKAPQKALDERSSMREAGAGRAPGRPRAVGSTAGAPVTRRPRPQRVLVSYPCLGGVSPCAHAISTQTQSEGLRARRVSWRGGSRAHAHQPRSQCAPYERPCTPLHFLDMPAKSAMTSRRHTQGKGDEHRRSSCQQRLIGCCMCCHHAAHLRCAIVTIPELPDLTATSSRMIQPAKRRPK